MLAYTSPNSKGKGKEVKIPLSINRQRPASSSSCMAMSFDTNFIPDDIWLTVFDLLAPPELGALSSTCHKFYRLTQRPLLREITWAKAPSAQRNVADWGPGGSLAQFTGIPRKVKIRLNFKKVNQNGALVATVDWEFYDAVFYRLTSFSNLHSLELADTILTPALYPVLAAIPSLRELSITRCTFIWSPLYPAILSTLGRPIPPGGIPDLYSAQRGDQINVPAQRQWFIDNHSFDFNTRLNHLTHLTFKYNRLGQLNDRPLGDGPYPPSEIGKPCILHPLYLLTIPSLTDLTLSWSPLLMQVFDTLKQSYDFTQTNQPLNAHAAPAAIVAAQGMFAHPGIPATALANALHASNSFGLNVFTPLRPNFSALDHVTLLVDDLSRDTMDSLVHLFDRRVNSPAPGLGPLRSVLRVGKHTLTEQHIGSVQFRLPGVYRYEGPLVIAGLLAAGADAMNTVNALEEVRMTEALDMTTVLFNLEKLPRTLTKLDIRVFKWDQEILYAVRALFKGLTELVIRYGKGGLSENTHVILGSDILPELTRLHTLRILPSNDCVKREHGQQRFPYNGTTIGAHAFSNYTGGGMNGNGNNAWWAMPSHNLGGGGGGGWGFNQPHHHPNAATGPNPPVDLDDDVYTDDEDFDDDVAAQFALMDQGQGVSIEEQAYLDTLDAMVAMDDAVAAAAAVHPPTGGAGSGSSTAAAAAAASGSTSAAATPAPPFQSPNSGFAIHGTSPLAHQPRGFRGRGGHSATLSSFATLGSWEVAPVPPGSAAAASSNPSSSSGTTTASTPVSPPSGRRRSGLWQQVTSVFSGSSSSTSRVSSSTTVSPSTSQPQATSTSRQTQAVSPTRTHRPNAFTVRSPTQMTSSFRIPSTGSASRAAESSASATAAAIAAERYERLRTAERDEQTRITASLREDLGDYLVGWNRHCRSLRTVQIDHDTVWRRRFEGDMWKAEDPRGGRDGKSKKGKGKGRAF